MRHETTESIVINPQFGGAAPIVSSPTLKDEIVDEDASNNENKPFLTHAEDFIQAIPKGLASALKETTRTVFGEDVDTPLSDWILENTGKMETNTGDITSGIVKFTSFYAGPGKIFGPLKNLGPAGQVAQTTFRGGMADAFTMGKDDQRLSHTLKGMEWDNALIDYLSSPSESQYEDKFKHFVEGGILGLGLDIAVISTKQLFGGYASLKAALKASGKTDGEIAQELRVLAEQGALAHQNIAETVETLEKQAAQDALAAQEVLANQGGKDLTTDELEQEIIDKGYDNLGDDFEIVPFNSLPRDLKGARPKFDGENIKFANDFEKALYIMGNTKKPSKRHNDYLQFALTESGMPREDLLILSKAMRAEVKSASAQGREVDFSDIVIRGKRVTKEILDGKEGGQIVTSTGGGTNVEALMDSLTAPIPDGVKPPAVTINYEKTNFGNLETDEAKRMIEAGANKSQVQTNDITKGRADQILRDETPEEIMTHQVDNVAELAEYDVAVRTLLSQAGNTMEVAMKGAKTADDRLEVLLSAPELFIMLRETAEVTQEAGTKIARALQSRNIKVDSKAIIKTMKSLTPLLQKAGEARKLAQEGGEVLPLLSKDELAQVERHMEELITLTTSQVSKLRSPLDKLDPNDTKWMKMWQVLTEIKLAGQLSAFTTQAAAAIGTGIKRGSYKMENYYAYTLGVIYKDADRLKWNELRALNATDWKKAVGTLQMMKNMLKSIPNENIKMEETLQRTSLDGFITKLDEQTSQAAITKEYLFKDPDSMMGNFLGGTVDNLGAINRLPFTMLALQDDAAKRMFYLPHINYKAITEGNKRGLKGADLTNYVSEVNKAFEIFYLKKGNREFEVMMAMAQAQKEAVGLEGKALDDYLLAAKEKVDAKLKLTDEEQALVNKHINPEWHSEALESGREMTFQSELKGDSVINRTITLIAEGRDIHPTAKWILPYYKTVINMTKEVARRTPGLHKLSETMNADMKAGGRKKRMAQAKLLQGTAMYTIGYQLMSDGYITPTSDKNNYQVMKDAGVAEASLQLPWMDKPIALNRIEPVGTYLLMMAELGKATDQVRRMNIENPEEMMDKMGEIAALYSLAFADVFVNKTMMDSVDQFTRALDDPESTYWANLAVTATVPGSSLIKSFTQEQGDILYEAKTVGEVFLKSLGSHKLRKELNLLGEPQGHIERYYGYRTKMVTDKFVLQELHALGADVKKIKKELSLDGIPIKLDEKDYYQLQLYVKQANLEGQLLALFNSPVYRNANIGYSSEAPGTKKWLVRGIVSNAHATAKAIYLENHKEVLKEYKKGIKQKLRDMQNNISESTAKPMKNFLEFQNK